MAPADPNNQPANEDPGQGIKPDPFRAFTATAKALTAHVRTMLSIIRDTIRHEKSLKVGYGVGGLGIIIALVGSFIDLRIAVVGVPVVIVYMFILSLYGVAARTTNRKAVRDRIRAARFLMWFMVGIFTLFVIALLASLVLSEDIQAQWHIDGIRSIFRSADATLAPSDPPEVLAYENFKSNTYITPEARAASVALVAVRDYWRTPEPSKRLIDERCDRITADELFAMTNADVEKDPVLAKNLSVIADFYNGIAKCVNDGKCTSKVNQFCADWSEEIQDFVVFYSIHFHKLEAREGDYELKDVKAFLEKCDIPKTKLTCPETSQ